MPVGKGSLQRAVKANVNGNDAIKAELVKEKFAKEVTLDITEHKKVTKKKKTVTKRSTSFVIIGQELPNYLL